MSEPSDIEAALAEVDALRSAIERAAADLLIRFEGTGSDRFAVVPNTIQIRRDLLGALSPAKWERFDYEDGTTIWQRECPDCEQGLLLAPVRFCPRCNGSGYLTTSVLPV